jgi:hypothetical protein
VLDPLHDLELPEDATVADLAAAAAARLGWRPAAKLLRLPGFDGAWDRCLLAGRLLDPKQGLVAAGVKAGDAVTYVRVELVAEGWKVRRRGGGEGEQAKKRGEQPLPAAGSRSLPRRPGQPRRVEGLAAHAQPSRHPPSHPGPAQIEDALGSSDDESDEE